MLDTLPPNVLRNVMYYVSGHEECTEYQLVNHSCDHCRPWWHGWQCSFCTRKMPFLWHPIRHFRQCGQSCQCCRAVNPEDMGCELCEDLTSVSFACRTTRRYLLRFNPLVTLFDQPTPAYLAFRRRPMLFAICHQPFG